MHCAVFWTLPPAWWVVAGVRALAVTHGVLVSIKGMQAKQWLLVAV